MFGGVLEVSGDFCVIPRILDSARMSLGFLGVSKGFWRIPWDFQMFLGGSGDFQGFLFFSEGF